jgi:hypothetical protein
MTNVLIVDGARTPMGGLLGDLAEPQPTNWARPPLLQHWTELLSHPKQ